MNKIKIKFSAVVCTVDVLYFLPRPFGSDFNLLFTFQFTFGSSGSSKL